MLCPAAAAHPPQIQPMTMMNRVNGIQNLNPGGIRLKPTIGTSPVAII